MNKSFKLKRKAACENECATNLAKVRKQVTPEHVIQSRAYRQKVLVNVKIQKDRLVERETIMKFDKQQVRE